MFVLRLGKTLGIHPDIANDIRIKRHVANDLNTTENKERDQFVVRLDSLLSDRVMKLCQAKHSCSQGPPGPPGQPGTRGTKGSRGRRGPRGKKRNKGRRRNHGIAWKRWKARHHGPSGAQRRARVEGTDRAPRGDWQTRNERRPWRIYFISCGCYFAFNADGKRKRGSLVAMFSEWKSSACS